jgi:hypothetical protein
LREPERIGGGLEVVERAREPSLTETVVVE